MDKETETRLFSPSPIAGKWYVASISPPHPKVLVLPVPPGRGPLPPFSVAVSLSSAVSPFQPLQLPCWPSNETRILPQSFCSCCPLTQACSLPPLDPRPSLPAFWPCSDATASDRPASTAAAGISSPVSGSHTPSLTSVRHNPVHAFMCSFTYILTHSVNICCVPTMCQAMFLAQVIQQ